MKAFCVGTAIVIVVPAFGISPLHIAIAALPISTHFDPIINALTVFHGRTEHFADFLDDELDPFMARLKTIEERLQENKVNRECLQLQLKRLEALLLRR